MGASAACVSNTVCIFRREFINSNKTVWKLVCFLLLPQTSNSKQRQLKKHLSLGEKKKISAVGIVKFE